MCYNKIMVQTETRLEKTDVLALAYHQLKTHVTAVRGYSELLLKKISGPLTERQEWYISDIFNHTIEMFAAIDNFLQAARLEGGELFLRKEKVKPDDAIEEAINSISFLAKARNAEVVFEKPKKKIPSIFADSVVLKQTLINLIYNSCKYHRGRVKIEVEAKKENNSIKFLVKDNGIGVPEDEKDKIFTKFFRGKEAQLIDAKGYGLGLYVSRAMIRALGGEIDFESKLNKGSTFWFTLPIHRG